MRLTMFRALVLGLLVTALVLPAGELRALAQQQAPPKGKQEPKQEPKPPEKPAEFAISVDVPLVNVDVVATDASGNFIPGLKRENFRILEDGVPQTITNFAPTEAPITVVLLVEYSKLAYGWFSYKSNTAAYEFLRHLSPNDWVALVSYDMRWRMEVDFTRDKHQIQMTLNQMFLPAFTEANLFDALLDTLDRLQDVKGKKAVLILASGHDTFSKHTLDDVLKTLRRTDVTIFAVGVGKEYFESNDARGAYGGAARVGYYQAENQLNSFARMTGGRGWFPRFDGELPGIFREVAGSLRNQYSLGYVPINQKRDGKFRKIKVELVNVDGTPITIVDQRGKKVKYVVYAREGYTAPKGSVGD
jgi:VWFA-related protein